MSDYPAFRLEQVFAMRERLMDRVLGNCYGDIPDGDYLLRVCNELRSVLPAGIERHVLFESVRWLAGQMLTAPLCRDLAWRLAANVERMRDGVSVAPWASQSTDEWVPCQVLQAIRGRNHFEKSGLSLTLQVLAGTPCPMRIRKFWTHQECERVGLAIGFSRATGLYPYATGEQLVGLRFLANIIAAKSVEMPWFKEIGAPQYCISFNREILKIRMRHKPCPFNWQHECHRCAVGYEACSAATHPRNYEKRFCMVCKSEAFFDIDVSTTMCVTCDNTNRLRRS